MKTDLFEQTSIPMNRKQLVEQTLQDMNLSNLVNIEKLQKLQDNLSAVTGIAMVTVDFKGGPITEETNFSSFCRARREISQCKANCFFSDAYGSLKAAMLNSPYIYHCPMGLVDCAVPIIVENNHIGAVLMGQVRCEANETSSLEDVENIVQNEIDLEEFPELKEKFYDTELIELSHLEKTAQLVQHLICEMVEKEVTARIQTRLHVQIEQLQEQVSILKARQRLSKKEQMNQETYIGQFMLSTLTMLSTISVLEDADYTTEGISIYAQLLNKIQSSPDGVVSVHTEINFIRKIVNLLKDFFHHEIDLFVTPIGNVDECYLPPLLLYPFIENSILHGILGLDYPGKININITQQKDKYIFVIEDNGIGMDMNTLSDKISTIQLTSLDIESTRNRLETIFHQKDLIKFPPSSNKNGLAVEITIPIEEVK